MQKPGTEARLMELLKEKSGMSEHFWKNHWNGSIEPALMQWVRETEGNGNATARNFGSFEVQTKTAGEAFGKEHPDTKYVTFSIGEGFSAYINTPSAQPIEFPVSDEPNADLDLTKDEGSSDLPGTDATGAKQDEGEKESTDVDLRDAINNEKES